MQLTSERKILAIEVPGLVESGLLNNKFLLDPTKWEKYCW